MSQRSLLTLYVHIPYCLRKCPYCDFCSSAVTEIPEARYLAALQRELRLRRQRWVDDPRPLTAIFFGGGTPSLLASATIAGILEEIFTLWPRVADCEITLEANPESANREKMRDWKEMGINRLSLGIQALDEARLHFLERPHTLERARDAIDQAIGVGFDAFNLDLIYATPGQTPAGWERELAEAMRWHPHHLSCYPLTIEPGTPFYKRHQEKAWSPVTEKRERILFQQTRRQLAEGGWLPYETSNFAKPGFSCRHNCNYWTFGDYIGVGCGAHGKWTDGVGQIWRSENPTNATRYMDMAEDGATDPHHPLAASHLVTPVEAGREMMLMGLRHEAGVDLALYQRLTGESLTARHAARIASFQEAGFVRMVDQRLCLTEQGVLLTDAILLAFM